MRSSKGSVIPVKDLDKFTTFGLSWIIDAGVKTIVDFGTNDMMPHFIYCYDGKESGIPSRFQKLRGIMLEKMRKYENQSSILTTIYMVREILITKEKAKKATKEEVKNDPLVRCKVSINDDLDSFIKNLQNSNEMRDEDVLSFLTPKLTKEELKPVEQKNEEHMMTYAWELRADVDVEEMKKSDSKDKYVFCCCERRTVHLTLQSNRKRKLSPSKVSSESSIGS